MFCPNCTNEIIFKEGENTAVCENCGCVLTLSVTVSPPLKETGACAADIDKKEGKNNAAEIIKEAPSPAAEKKDADAAKENNSDLQAEQRAEDGPAKKQTNVFGPAALALGVLTIVFAFLAGLKALVLGIPAVIVSGLALLASFLVKSMKKRLAVAGLILSAIGIIIAVIMHSGLVF